jgi:hypothetical protein
LATPRDVANHLKKVAKGRGSSILYEQHDWGPRAYAAGTTDAIPVKWKFTARRLEELAKMVEKGS